MHLRAFIVVPLVLALAAPAGADHCDAYTTSDPILTFEGDRDEPTRYVVNDVCPDPCEAYDWAVLIYEESNGIAGLQRVDGYDDDTCHNSIAGDTILHDIL